MQEQLDLGPTPCDEDCAQVGSKDYDYMTRARKECKAYIAQLTRMHGEPPEGARFKITHNPHDFGTYLDVAVVYDPENEKAREYAWNIEQDSPNRWDEKAREELEVEGPRQGSRSSPRRREI